MTKLSKTSSNYNLNRSLIFNGLSKVLLFKKLGTATFINIGLPNLKSGVNF